MLWTGRVLTALFGLFMLMDGGVKLIVPPPEFVTKGTKDIGFPEGAIFPLGVVVTVSTILYLVPRTSVLGAILLTGYLGGAVATHVHVGHGAFEILLPALFGVVAWLGLVLRDERLRSLLPLRM
jgi:hypothetical protein